MKRPDIWVDCDGVLADFVGTYLGLHAMLNGRACCRDEVTAFDFSKCVATPEEDEKIWRHIDKTPGIVRGLVAIPGAADALEELRTIGHVRCLTSPHLGPTWMHERAQWLAALGFKKADIVFCSDKKLVHGDVLIDDKLETVLEYKDHHPRSVPVLFDAPYNQREPSDRLLRARGWTHAVYLVRWFLAAREAA